MAAPETAAPSGAPPGWYPDPGRAARLRYWDGEQWTPGVSDGKRVREVPLDADGAAAAWDELADRRGEWPAGVAGVAVLAVVLGTAATVLTAAAFDAVTDALWVLIAIPQLALWGVLLTACRWASRRHGTGSLRRDFGLTFKGIDVVAGLGVAGVARLLAVIVVIPIVVIDAELGGTNSTVFGAVEDDAAALAVLVLIALVGAPFVEEIFFRGLFQRALECSRPVAQAIALQAVLFGLVHFSPAFGRANVTIIAATAAAGVVFGATARYARRLGPGIAGHAVFNLLPVAVILAA